MVPGAAAPQSGRLPLGSAGLLKLLRHLQQLPPRGVLVAALVLVPLLALVDHLSGSVYTLNIGYVLIVVAVSASGRLGYSLSIAAVVALAWGAVDWTADQGSPSSQAWNGVARFAVPYVCAMLVTAVSEMARVDREMSRADPLTGLLNLRGFRELADLQIARGERSPRPCTLLYLDIDGFKNVNDSRGHAAGDLLLTSVARTLTTGARRGDVVARLGGDEFAVLLADAAEATAQGTADRVRTSLDRVCADDDWPVRFSIGVVTFVGSTSVDELLSEADRLMYDAKREGKATSCSTVMTGIVVRPSPSRAPLHGPEVAL